MKIETSPQFFQKCSEVTLRFFWVGKRILFAKKEPCLKTSSVVENYPGCVIRKR